MENPKRLVTVDHRFPLIAQNPVPGGVHIVSGSGIGSVAAISPAKFNEILDGIVDCGCNAVIVGGTEQEMTTMLDAMVAGNTEDKADVSESLNSTAFADITPKLSVILAPPWITYDEEVWSQNMSEFVCKRALVGWEIMDQPTPEKWELSDTGFRKAYEVAMKKYGYSVPQVIACENNPDYPNHPDPDTKGGIIRPDLPGPVCDFPVIPPVVYFNLAASELKSWIGDTGCYQGYLTLLQRMMSPMLWSYDLYPFYINSDVTESWEAPVDRITVRHHDFYRYLKLFSDQANATGTTFWAYCMCMAHKAIRKINEDGSMSYINYQPAPTLGMLRFEAYSSLAFGAQALVYWSYGQLSDSSRNIFGMAPLLRNLKTSEIHSTIKSVNAQIRKYEQVFMGSKCMAACHIGDDFATGDVLTEDIKDALPISDIRFKDSQKDNVGNTIKNIYSGFLITLLENDCDNTEHVKYMIVVNHDPFYAKRIEFYMKKDYKVQILTDNLLLVDIHTGKLSGNINAGDWLIIQYRETT